MDKHTVTRPSRRRTAESPRRDTERELGELRGEIDRFDGWILALLRARGEVVMEIARLKQSHGLGTRDPDREEEMLCALTREPPSPFTADEVREVFQAVFHAGLRLQEPDRPPRKGIHETRAETEPWW
jgi:chorismate mutase